MSTSNRRRILLAGLLCSVSGSVAAEPTIRLSSGLDFASGDFGAEIDTEILTIPFQAAIGFEDFELYGSTSYLDLRTAGDVIPGGTGPIVTQRCARILNVRPDLFDRLCRGRLSGDPDETRFSNSGLGDTTLGAVWFLPASVTGSWLVDLGASVKLPTASESKSLGTGKTDATFSLDITRGIGAVTLYAGGGYRILGDPSFERSAGRQATTITLEDGPTATAGLIYSFEDGTSLSLGYDFLAETVADATSTQEVTLGLSVPFGDSGWQWTGYGVAGLTRSSVDFAAGLSISYSFSGL